MLNYINIYTILFSSLGSSTLIGIIVWFSRTWLKKKLEKSVDYLYDTQLETHKSELQKNNDEFKQKFLLEIETYKSSLIRELEEYKLKIDLKRNMALQYSDKQLQAYEKILITYNPIILEIATYSSTNIKFREKFEPFSLRNLELSKQAQKAQLPYELYIDAIDIGIPLSTFYKDLVHFLSDETNFNEETKVDHLLTSYGMIKSIMKSSLIGEENDDQFLERLKKKIGLNPDWDEFYLKYSKEIKK